MIAILLHHLHTTPETTELTSHRFFRIRCVVQLAAARCLAVLK